MRALLAFSLLLTSNAWAETRNPYLQQAKVFYQGLEFEKCLKRLDQAGKWENTNDQLADIELYQGLCVLASGKDKVASEHFELALSIDDKLQLPPLQGPKVTALFEKVRTRVAASKQTATPMEQPEPKPEPKPELKPELKPEPMPADAPIQSTLTPVEAPAPDVVVTAPPRERRLAVPLVIGGVGVVAVGVAAFFGVEAKSFEQQANAAAFESDAVSLGKRARTDALIANVGFGAAGVAAATAILTYLLMN